MFLILLAQSGKAHMLLKSSSKPRKRKAELEIERKRKHDELAHVDYLKNVEYEFNSKKLKFDEALTLIDQNERLISYLKANGIMDDNGNIK